MIIQYWLGTFGTYTLWEMFHCTGKGGQAQSLKSAEAPKRQSAKWHRSAKASLSVKASKRHMQRAAKVVRSAGTWLGGCADPVRCCSVSKRQSVSKRLKASKRVKAPKRLKASKRLKAPKRVKAPKRLKAPKHPKPPQQVLVKHKFWYTPCLLCMSRAYHVSRNLIWIGAAKLLSQVAWPACVWLWPRVVLQEYQHESCQQHVPHL